MSVNKIWNTLFGEERPSIGLSFFRMAVALTVGFHVIPSFFHLDNNYFSMALKTLNDGFFISNVLALIQKSPDGLVVFFVGLFLVSWFGFLIGLFSQFSCIIMTLCCYYFYALNDFYIGTLSWNMLLVALFLMCLVPYHGDYFSIDALRRRNPQSYQRLRPFFLQRLLQLQIASMFFYTAFCNVFVYGGNPIYYLMNYPPEGDTKYSLFKEWMASRPEFCYWTGVFIVMMELALPFLLFCPKTRRSAILLGFSFHILLLLTLDVSAIFFFLFPAQLLLFIHPQKEINWINRKRSMNASSPRFKVIYDGHCHFCRRSIEQLQVMDLFARCDYVDYHSYVKSAQQLEQLHPSLSKQLVASQLHFITPDGKIYGGFFAFRQMAWLMPMLYPLLPLMYLPTADWLGLGVYRFIAQNRYLLHFNRTCEDNHCFRL